MKAFLLTSSTPRWTQTINLRFRRALLYSVELLGHIYTELRSILKSKLLTKTKNKQVHQKVQTNYYVLCKYKPIFTDQLIGH